MATDVMVMVMLMLMMIIMMISKDSVKRTQTFLPTAADERELLIQAGSCPRASGTKADAGAARLPFPSE